MRIGRLQLENKVSSKSKAFPQFFSIKPLKEKRKIKPQLFYSRKNAIMNNEGIPAEDNNNLFPSNSLCMLVFRYTEHNQTEQPRKAPVIYSRLYPLDKL